jgi:hypothetical protein
MLRSLFALMFASLFISFQSCTKEKEPDYGFLDVRNSKWEVKGNFGSGNTTVVMSFKSLGEGQFGTVSANWIQSGNEIMWLTSDNKRFEARLRSTVDMRGDFYDRDGQVPLGSFTAKKND